jgi:hypothetical protein
MRRILPLSAVLLLVFVGAGGAEESRQQGSTQTAAGQPGDASAKQASAGPLYKLPSVGKPRRRVGGGRRGPASELPKVFTLVPEHVGLTVSEQPQLFWYLSADGPGTVAFELTLIDEESIEPVVDVRIDHPEHAGLQRIDLSDFGVSLAVGQEYQWSVSLVVGDEERSLDVVSTGWIERVAPSAALAAGLEQTPPEQRATLYGEAGIWYDLVASLVDRLPAARGDFERLLVQVDLPAQAAR